MSHIGHDDWGISRWGKRHDLSQMGRRERRRCETRERIFRAAMGLFRDHGFHGTTVENITEAADVGKGTFFNYFPSKEHVLGVLGEVQMGKYDKAVEIAQREGIEKALHWLYRALPSEFGASTEMVRSLMTVFMTSPAVREFLCLGLARGRGMLTEMLADAQRQGEIPRRRTPEELALRFQQSLFGAMLQWTLTQPTPPVEAWLDRSFDFYWAAVTAGRS